MNNIENRELNIEEQKIVLNIARQSIVCVCGNTQYYPDIEQYPIFKNKCGVFVTLHKNGNLRGCIGTFDTNKTLSETIQEMAISAAFNDPRFDPLEKYELGQVRIEISVLSPKEKISDPEMIEVGKHGVYVQKGDMVGVYLPQVATQADWNREQFLNHLCEHKAGIGRDAWRDGSAQIYIFTTQVFGE